MWGTVLLMAIVAVADPVRIGAVALMLSRTRPMSLLLAYFTAAFAANLMVGAVVLFLLKDDRLAPTASAAGKTEIAIGLLALLVGALVVWGFPGLLRYRARTRHTEPYGAEGDVAVTHSGTTAIGQPAVERLPGFTKLVASAQAALRSESLWVGWIVGLAMALPPAYYLVAIAAIHASGAAAGSQILGLLMYNLVAFVVAEIPIVSFSVAPEATRARLEQFHAWTKAHYRLVVGTLAGAVGILLIFVGLSQGLATSSHARGYSTGLGRPLRAELGFSAYRAWRSRSVSSAGPLRDVCRAPRPCAARQPTQRLCQSCAVPFPPDLGDPYRNCLHQIFT
jgi:hypothetical protein